MQAFYICDKKHQMINVVISLLLLTVIFINLFVLKLDISIQIIYALLAIALSYSNIYIAFFSKIIIDETSRKLTFKMFKSQSIPLNQIESIEYWIRDNKQVNFYYLILYNKNKERLLSISTFISDEKQILNIQNQINEYIQYNG